MNADRLDRLIDLVADYPDADAAGQIAITDEIIDLLGLGAESEPAAPDVVIAVDPASQEASAAAAIAWMDSAEPSEVNEQMAFALVSSINLMVRYSSQRTPQQKEAIDKLYESLGELRKRLRDSRDSEPGQAMADLLVSFTGDGQSAYSAAAAKDEAESIRGEVAAIQAQYDIDAKARNESLREPLERIRNRLRELQSQDSDQAVAEWKELQQQWRDLVNTNPVYEKFQAALKVVQDRIDKAYSDCGAKLRNEVLATSSITETEAKAWADAQIVEDAALERIARYGYKRDQLRADMAEFYRLTGGRLPAIKIENQSRRRANASAGHGHSESVIRVGTGFDKRVLFHEMAHHLEADPSLYGVAQAFLVKRREGPETYKLRALTKNTRYESDEVAYKDSWMDAYVGKVYQHQATEVMSMGMERFSSDTALGYAASLDPEMYALMIGAMKSKPHPAAVAMTKLRHGLVTAAREESAEKAATMEQLLKEAAGLVIFRATGQIEEDQQMAYWARNSGIGGPKAQFLGEWNGRWFYRSPTVRNQQTKRKGRGIVVLWKYGSNGCSHMAFPGDDVERAKAEAWFYVNTGYYLSDTSPQRLADALAEYRKRQAEVSGQ